MALELALMAGGQLLGGILGSRSADRAADAQTEAARLAADEQRRQFDLTRSDFAPFMQGGQRAAAALDYELGLGRRPQVRRPDVPGIRRIAQPQPAAPTGLPANPPPNMGPEPRGGYGSIPTTPQAQPGPRFAVGGERFDTRADAREYRNTLMGDRAPVDSFNYRGFRETPGYDFRFNEGLDAQNATLAASGMLGSGRALRAATRYGQNVASEEYGNYLNRLAAASGRGQTQVNALAGYGANMAGNVGNALMAGGAAQAQGIANQGNIMSQTLEGLGGIAGRYFGQQTPNTLAPMTYSPSPYGASVAPTSSFM